MHVWALRAEIFRRFVNPIKFISWSAVGGMLCLWALLPLNAGEKIILGGLVIITPIYLVLIYNVLIPRLGVQPWMHFLIIVFDVVFITVANVVLRRYQVSLVPLYVLTILFSGMLAGKRAVWLAAGLSFLGSLAVENVYDLPTNLQTLSQALHLLIFCFTAMLGGSLGNALTRQIGESKQKNENLSLLLEASLIATSSLDLKSTLPKLAEKIVVGLPVSYARIDSLNGEQLVCYGQAGFRVPLNGVQRQTTAHRIAELPWCRQAIGSRQTVQAALEEITQPETLLAFYSFFPNEVNHATFVPLVVTQKVVGLISVGEARQSSRESFHRQKLDFLETLANQISVVIDNAALHQAELRKSKRLEVLNEIGRVIGSTIEMNELLENLYSLLMQVLPADTYYVGVLKPEQNVIDLLLLIDEGERFNGKQLLVDSGFAGYVVREQKPILVHQMSAEWERLPVKPVIVGQEKHSESWLGVPMNSGRDFRGILAIASYSPNMFSEEDLSLLGNVASQAALALDNAQHHRNIEERARRDSLTGSFNHGYFLVLLNQMVKNAKNNQQPLSLIMLDVDYFKEYNDSYGHLIGDEVLSLVVNAIQQMLSPDDVIGRWGGEEFSIILNNTTPEMACEFAQRIHDKLGEMALSKINGVLVPAPTISQGIATLPFHALDSEQLIERADQALYIAKAAGRDQIRVFGEKIPC